MTFEVMVKEDLKESNLSKGQIVTVYDVNWHKATTVEGRGFIFFLIFNPAIDRFIYEDQSAFRPLGRAGAPSERPQAH